MTLLSHLSVDELADGICLRAGRIAAAEAELLAWIGEFDERGGWSGVGMLSCAHWLSWKTGLSPGAARERVRVAARLRELPVVGEAFGRGEMSWSQVRAISRVARPDDGIDWPHIARSTSGAQIETLVRGIRRAHAATDPVEDCERAAWLLRTRKSYDADGNLVLTIIAKPEVAPVVEAAFDAKRAELERERVEQRAAQSTADPADSTASAELETEGGDVPAGAPRTCCRRHAEQDRSRAELDVPTGAWGGEGDTDAAPGRITDGEVLLAVAQATLAQHTPTADFARRTRFRLRAEVDPLSGWGRLRDGELLPPTSLKAVMKALPGRGGGVRLRPLMPADLCRFDLGRTQREVSANLRELLGTIDGERCRFPGCTRHRNLHGHHVVYWSRGSGTDLDNLVLVCARHHTLIHQQGFLLVLHPDRRLEVRTADDVEIRHLPTRPWGDPDDLDPGRRITASTATPPHFQPRMDLDYAVAVLMSQAA